MSPVSYRYTIKDVFCSPFEMKTIDLICTGLNSRTIKIRTSMAIELSDTYNAQCRTDFVLWSSILF